MTLTFEKLEIWITLVPTLVIWNMLFDLVYYSKIPQIQKSSCKFQLKIKKTPFHKILLGLG